MNCPSPEPELPHAPKKLREPKIVIGPDGDLERFAVPRQPGAKFGDDAGRRKVIMSPSVSAPAPTSLTPRPGRPPWWVLLQAARVRGAQGHTPEDGHRVGSGQTDHPPPSVPSQAEQGGPGPADMQETGRRGGKTGNDRLIACAVQIILACARARIPLKFMLQCNGRAPLT